MGRSLSLLAIIAVVIVLVAGCGDPVRNDNTVGQVRVMTYNIHHAAGMLESALTMSFEQYVISDEIIGKT